MHGVPVLLKDNMATRDRLNTTAGSLALLGSVVRRDAGVAARLRAAGAVILGKASLSEWSNFRPVKSGWSARGGQTVVTTTATTHALLLFSVWSCMFTRCL
jgi:amidase